MRNYYSNEDVLAAIEERAFCEGYNARVQERMYAEEGESSFKKHLAIGAGAGVGAAAAGLGTVGYLGRKGQKKLAQAKEISDNFNKLNRAEMAAGAYDNAMDKMIADTSALRESKLGKLGKFTGDIEDKIKNTWKEGKLGKAKVIGSGAGIAALGAAAGLGTAAAIKAAKARKAEKIADAVEEAEKEFSAFCEGYDYAQREFGAKSKILGLIDSGAYSGKELAKLQSNSPEEYEETKNKAALKGFLAPITTTRKLEKAHMMAAKGYTPDEIRKTIGSANAKQLLAEGLTAPVSHAIGKSYGYYRGLADMDKESRKEAKKRTTHDWEK